ncbi:MAG: hypothetical protein MI919_38950, partial [Holophagales bacterium]|nr:hypothetical protein [Holophagales bacterium]
MRMERLGLLGVHWRTGTEVLERFTLPREARAELLPRLAEEAGVSEMLYLATCNRVEILFAQPSERSGPDLRAPFFRALKGREPEPGEAERTFRAWGGEGAAEHLLLVAAGLDSAQLGEHEIRGQLRESHAEAQELGLTGPRLDFLIETAMRV